MLWKAVLQQVFARKVLYPIMGRGDAGSKYGASALEVSQAREIMESQRSRTC
jgi:hypothetical protein